MEADSRVHLANPAAMQQYRRHRRQTAAAGPDPSRAAADGGGQSLDRAGGKSPSGALLHRRRSVRTHGGTPSTAGSHMLYVPQMPGKRKWEVRGARGAAYAPLAAAESSPLPSLSQIVGSAIRSSGAMWPQRTRASYRLKGSVRMCWHYQTGVRSRAMTCRRTAIGPGVTARRYRECVMCGGGPPVQRMAR